MIDLSNEWKNLERHHDALAKKTLMALFSEDSEREKHFQLEAASITLNFSKNHVSQETLSLLNDLAKHAQLASHINALFSGHPVNTTENRPALHTLLRSKQAPHPDLQSRWNEVQTVLKKMRSWCDEIQKKNYFTDVVHIGIGGSALGPNVVYEALQPYKKEGLNCYFVSNMDPADLYDVLSKITIQKTLFIFASKSFTTEEMLCNAEIVKKRLFELGGEEAIKNQCIAITASSQAAKDFGVDENNIFPFWEWVGGRFSLWSAISLAIALCMGMPCFEELLAGAHAMDEHFHHTPFEKNLPVTLALLGIWYRNFWHTQSHAIIPYSHLLRSLPLYLQQLDMESNGKYITKMDSPVSYATGSLIWGAAGSNSQHSFHQWFHQGTDFLPIDFIIAKESHYDQTMHKQLYANCTAQMEVLMRGQVSKTPYCELPGNRPSTLITFEKLTPFNLGALLALYEHKVFVQGIIWNINSFDQWGVEAGKKLAKQLLKKS